MLVQHLCIETGALLGCKCVEVAPNGIHFRSDLRCGTPLGPLKEHVLNKMRRPGLLLSFAHGPRINPYAHGNGAIMFHRFTDHADPIFQLIPKNHSFVLAEHIANAHGIHSSFS